MTIGAAVFHLCRFPWRGMTGFTLLAGLRMRCNPAKHLPTLSIQGAGVIQQPAFGISISSNDQCGDQSRNHPCPRQTPQPVIISHLPSRDIQKFVAYPFISRICHGRIVYRSIAPPLGGMTFTAIVAIFSVMFILMTGNTLCRSTLIRSIGMALRTVEFCMLAHKRETGIVMVERCVSPPAGRVAGTAIRTKLTVVLVLVGMTGITIGGRPLVTIGMTGFALNVVMLAGKWETGIAMIETNVGPFGRLMAGAAIGAKLTFMGILP